jgi:GTPase
MSRQNDSDSCFRSAFVALVGRPNSGKSTLLNVVLGEALAITSPLPQTTRRNLRGIYTAGQIQIVFVDTPGIHEEKHALNKAISRAAAMLMSAEEVDIICYLVDLSRELGSEEDHIAAIASKSSLPICLVFSKTDKCDDVGEAIAAFRQRYPQLHDACEIALSLLDADAGQRFLAAITPLVAEGPRYYPADHLTDADLRFFAAEYIRKAIIDTTREEVPHASFVEIRQYKENGDRHKVEADIHVETQGQKGIIIGAQGRGIKKIQRRAEAALRSLTDASVAIRCHVKVSPHWRDNKGFLKNMGL